MMSNRKVRVSPEADIDLLGILQYSLETWGIDQALAYQATLDAAVHEIVRYPASGRNRSDLGPGYRSRPVEQHVVYYRIEGRIVWISRVLHARQDPTGRLT